jgi:DNA-directed RNA polymerase subunit delta
MAKPRIAKDYDKLSDELKNRIKLEHPHGFEKSLISFTDPKGVKVSALPFDTDDAYYLIKMTTLEAKRIIEEDEDYDSSGNLREDFAEEIAGADEAADENEEEEEDNYGDDPADMPSDNDNDEED